MLFLASVKGQVAKSSPLYREIKGLDSLIFEVGFNQCNFSPYDSLVSEDLEFYHDKGGITTGKAAFIASMKNGICNPPLKIKRMPDDSGFQVFPLFREGVLYGAIQQGKHLFFEYSNKQWIHTGTARFTNLWLLKNRSWKLQRVLSYDHL